MDQPGLTCVRPTKHTHEDPSTLLPTHSTSEGSLPPYGETPLHTDHWTRRPRRIAQVEARPLPSFFHPPLGCRGQPLAPQSKSPGAQGRAGVAWGEVL